MAKKENSEVSKNSPEEVETNKKTTKPEVKSKNLFQKHPMVFLLLGALIISVLWGVLKANRLEKAHQAQIEQLNSDHEQRMDSIALINASQLISSLTWAVRSEMTRDNLEQVNTYFIQLIKEPSMESIQLINHSTGEVLLSTNKKDEGKIITDDFILGAKAPQSIIKEDKIQSAAPVFGLSQQLGVLVIERTK
jgi:hypothetical protein